jgi:hypothetical protein
MRNQPQALQRTPDVYACNYESADPGSDWLLKEILGYLNSIVYCLYSAANKALFAAYYCNAHARRRINDVVNAEHVCGWRGVIVGLNIHLRPRCRGSIHVHISGFCSCTVCLPTWLPCRGTALLPALLPRPPHAASLCNTSNAIRLLSLGAA